MKNYILRAEDEIESAKHLYQNDFYRGTLNHCYYACTWLMRGLLAERGILIRMLDSAFSLFEEYVVHSEPIPNGIQQFIKMIVQEYHVLQKDIAGDFMADEILSYIEKTEDFLYFVKDQANLSERSN